MPSRALALSCAALALALATLGIKAAATDAALAPDIRGAKGALAQRLAGQGFAVRIEHRRADQDLVRAASGGCRIALRPEQSDEYAAAFAAQTPGLDHRGWIDRGRVVASFPTFSSVADNYWRRLAVRLGLPGRERWPIQLAHNGRCRIDTIDFGDQTLALLPVETAR